MSASRSVQGFRLPVLSAPLLVVALVMSARCSGSDGGTAPTQNPPPAATPTSTTVSGPASVAVGATAQFTATANFSNGTTQNVTSTATWASATPGVATVNGAGLAAGVAAGTTQIQATSGGHSGSAPLAVAADPPVARFTVSGPRGVDACQIIVDSGGNLDCTFDGSASTGGSGGAVVAWTWRFDVGTNSGGPVTDDDPTLTPQPGCGFFSDKPDDVGPGFVQMIVTLEVRNAAGAVSAEVRNQNVRLFHQNQCGF